MLQKMKEFICSWIHCKIKTSAFHGKPFENGLFRALKSFHDQIFRLNFAPSFHKDSKLVDKNTALLCLTLLL